MSAPVLQSQQPPWTQVAPASTADRESFAYTSCLSRWPTILTGVIDSLVHASAALAYARNAELAQARIDEAKGLIESISKLKHDLARNRNLEPIAPAKSSSEPDSRHFNAVIEHEQPTWFNASWLFAECHLYATLRALFAHSKHWQNFDPFALQKLQTLKSSGQAIRTLAKTVHAIISKLGSDEVTSSAEGQRALFLEMAAMSLWGNATDLSLLTSLSYADIQALQASSAEQQRAKARFILSNDLERAWDDVFAHLPSYEPKESSKGVRVDFVLDNSGFELYTDLLFADWLLSTGKVGEIVFHPKNMPWFVSDVNPSDFRHIITALLSPEDFFLGEDGSSSKKNAQGQVDTPEGIDPAYFADAHGRPCSPSASYIIDSTSVAPPSASQLPSSTSSAANAAEHDEIEALKATAARWVEHLDAGRFKLSMRIDAELGQRSGAGDFWTEPMGYSEMAKYGPELLAELQQSALVIFKGDLNYRKLTSDLNWPSTTPFTKALGPLAGQMNILALRTCKADVCVGLAEGVEEQVRAEDPKWRINGKWAVVQLALRQDIK
ncbi:Hairy/enhancer-of-split with YRPW motif protein 2 [Tilletia horrida]|nr:Hairy/enhancer-of-split with YRPW motif protein 2 [Tilletia horrida]